jgi:hypothetical protein
VAVVPAGNGTSVNVVPSPCTTAGSPTIQTSVGENDQIEAMNVRPVGTSDQRVPSKCSTLGSNPPTQTSLGDEPATVRQLSPVGRGLIQQTPPSQA